MTVKVLQTPPTIMFSEERGIRVGPAALLIPTGQESACQVATPVQTRRLAAAPHNLPRSCRPQPNRARLRYEITERYESHFTDAAAAGHQRIRCRRHRRGRSAPAVSMRRYIGRLQLFTLRRDLRHIPERWAEWQTIKCDKQFENYGYSIHIFQKFDSGHTVYQNHELKQASKAGPEGGGGAARDELCHARRSAQEPGQDSRRRSGTNLFASTELPP